jgi:hypothetical protein
MPTGLYRVREGWGNEHSVCVEYADGTRLEIGESLYRIKGCQPPLDELPWKDAVLSPPGRT